jgi:hypothetical protein
VSYQFDSQAEIVAQARTVAAGKTELSVRFPDDELWAERQRKCRIIVKQLGRGNTEMDTDYGDIDMKIYERVKQNGSPNLTPFEATRFLNTLAQAQVLDTKLIGEGAEVELRVFGGIVHHTLKRIPSAEEVHKLHKSGKQFQNSRGSTEYRLYVEPGATLYDACGGASEHYANGIPAIHKDAVIRDVIREADNELEPIQDERLF